MKFNVALSLCRVLEINLYFSEGFSEAVTEALQLLDMTVVWFIGQESSLEERSTHRVLGCFLGVENRDDLEEEFFADKATGDVFALFWRAIAVPEVEAFPCFWEWDLRASFSTCLA